MDSATTEIYTLSLHDALPISTAGTQHAAASNTTLSAAAPWVALTSTSVAARSAGTSGRGSASSRSEEHTSELQSRRDLVCRLLLEKKKQHWEEHFVLVTEIQA